MTTLAVKHSWQGKQSSSFGNFRRQRKPINPTRIQQDLQMCYDFGNGLSFDNSGTTVVSIGSTSFDGTLTNGPAYDTTYGGILTFDGVNDFITRAASLNTGQDFTVAVWVNPTSVGTTRRCVMANAQQWTIADKGWYFSIGQTGGANRFFLSIGSDNAYAISSNNTVTVGAWQYLAATVTSGGSSIQLYRNGILQTLAASVLSSRTISYSYATNYVARRDPTSNETDYFPGSIGSIAIYNRVLSGSELFQNFQLERAKYGI